MQTSEIHGARILIVGYGREGKSVESWLRIHYPSVHIDITDEIKNGSGYLNNLSSYDTVIRSPGVPPYLEAFETYRKNGGHMTSATNIFFSLVKGTTIGITGTKGKSTTTSLIARILEKKYDDVRLVGNIGYPMLDALDSSDKNTLFVIELSSHQLADSWYSPHIAVLLGIVPEHLDYYPSLSSYIQAKARIVKFQSENDAVIYNPDHTIVREIAEAAKSKRVVYRAQGDIVSGTGVQNGTVVLMNGTTPVPVVSLSEVPLLGNVENILAAVSVGHFLDVSREHIKDALQMFQSLPHRLEFVGEFREIRFYNDSLATIPEATIHALESFKGSVSTLIAGGYDRHLDFHELGSYLRSHPVKTLILFPDTGKKIQEAIGTIDPSFAITCYMVNTMEEAVRLAYEHTPEKTICLLSPASASYNLFKNYEDRGNQFKSWVKTFGVL